MLREPLVHFLVLGTALFLLHRWVAPPGADREVVVTAAAEDGLRQEFRRRTGREPSARDEADLVDRWVDDEILVREARALGLDRGDVVVRRRLLQKMELLMEGAEAVPDPSDADLQAFLAAHAERYASPERISFEHAFASADRHGAGAPEVALGLRRALEGGADPVALGDPFLRGREVRLYAVTELAGVFGPGFAAEVMPLPVGSWSAPIRSTYGWHVVRVSERRPATHPALGEIRARVAAEWKAERREAVDRAARAQRRKGYVVRLERDEP